MNYTPRWYQQESVDAIFNYFSAEDSGHPLVCLPTGSGKSLVQAMIAERILDDYPQCRLLFLTHQQELIKQNYMELIGNIGTMIDAGIYSAGLNSRDTQNKIIFAGIQSVYKKAKELGDFNLVIVDECHLIPKKGEGMYRSFLKDQRPYTKFIGLTATPYRLDSGLLTDGENAIFSEIIYDVPVRRLIDEGYLCELIGKQGIISPDTSTVHKRGGEFIEQELIKVCDNNEIIIKAVREIIDLTQNRKHVVLFCAGIVHAEHVAEEFQRNGESCAVIHSLLNQDVINKTIQDFRDGKIKYIANVNMLTTGFNARHIDCIAMLRPTMSTGLYYQECGRGLRTCEGKENCLILDYAGNILRHGPIDKIKVKTKGLGSDRGVETAPMKQCPKCGAVIFAALLTCPECGHEFPVSQKHGETASDEHPLSRYKEPVEYDVTDIYYSLHEKAGRISMRVSYGTGVMSSVSEWVCIEHGGFAEEKARQWLKKNLPPGFPIPDTVQECLEIKDEYLKPSKIYVDYNKDFPRIISKIY